MAAIGLSWLTTYFVGDGSVRSGQRLITVQDTAGRPIAGATVTLPVEMQGFVNGLGAGLTTTTDNVGEARFTVTRPYRFGSHGWDVLWIWKVRTGGPPQMEIFVQNSARTTIPVPPPDPEPCIVVLKR
jgi:hypothetical protein